MFKETRIRLALLNSVIFISVIIALSVVVYGYCKHNLYSDVNESLLTAAKLFEEGANDYVNDEILPDGTIKQNNTTNNPNVFKIYWTDDGQLSGENSDFVHKYEEEFAPHSLEAFEKVVADGFYFQTYSVDFVVSGTDLGTIQFIRNIDSQQELLDRLAIILILGNILGAAVIILFSYILSGKALKPINEALIKQQSFVSDASHELRTPLTVIQTKADIILREPNATVEDKVLEISAISKETRRLSKMVSNLLLLARSDSNQMELEITQFDLSAYIEEILEQYIEIASLHGKEIILDVKPGIIFSGDKAKIHQLIIILLDNAMKFTDGNGKIHVKCRVASSGNVELRVKDNGKGIRSNDIRKIFDRFYQADPSRTDVQGSGLGLSIAKWIVEKHNGRISVDSKVGKGTEFTVYLAQIKK